MGLLIMAAGVLGAFLAGVQDVSWIAVPVAALCWFTGTLVALPRAVVLLHEARGLAMLGPLLAANGLCAGALFGAGRLVALA
ncbi:hypothetical protein ACQW02_07510 [Humitalea sp. 24SJ18S-53]|uniref:hypothetical protein n=1 Tax=Humitalea sp. 24SJ18S-53 TaxID=3422307 RepID=UPI003D66F404